MAESRRRSADDAAAIDSRRRSLAQATGAMLLLSAAFVALALSLPHPIGADVRVEAGVGVAMAIAGLGARLLGGRLPVAASHVLLAGASASVGVLIVATGVATGGYWAIFVWAILIASYFFPRRVAAVHLAWMLGVYAAALLLVSSAAGYSPLTRWLPTSISLTVVMLLMTEIVSHRARADARARRFFEISQDMLSTMDTEGRCVEINDAWRLHLGYEEEDMRGRPLLEIAHPDDVERAREQARRVFAGEPAASMETRVRAKDGSWHWLRSTATYAPDEKLVYARSTDITELKLAEQERERLLAEVESLARTDPLTGLPNRRSLEEMLERETNRARRTGERLCVAVLDLDRFKSYNDAHGHLAGDRLLRECAIAWKADLRAADAICRFGGEEFVVVLPECEPEEAGAIVERLRAATPSGQTASVGLVAWDGAEPVEELLSRADRALYRAKAAGRDRLVAA